MRSRSRPRLHKVIRRTLLFTFVIYFLCAAFIYLFQESLIFHPKHLPGDYVFAFGEPFQELTLIAADGGQISAIEFSAAEKCKETLGQVIFVHGNGSLVSNLGGRAHDFTSRCWSILIFDYRPYGKSKGALSESSLLYDARAAYDYSIKTFSPSNIVIYAQSLGTGLAVKLAADVTPRSLILEAPYLSLLNVAQEKYPLFPIALLLKFPLRSDLVISKVKCPVIIFHGTKDRVIPFHNGEKLSKLVTSSLKFFGIEGAEHSNITHFREYGVVLDEVLGVQPTK